MSQKLASPRLTKISLTSADIQELLPEVSLAQISVAQAHANGLQAKNLSLDETLLEHVTFVEAQLEKLSLIDTECKACDFSAARCSESSFIRTHIIGGRMTGIDLSHSTLKDVVFRDCKLDMANCRFAKLVRVQFINCRMSETDFQAAELTDVEFQESHLEKVEFGHCKLKDVDARGSQLYDIRGWQSLKGLIVDSMQLVAIAPQLAFALGIAVKDD